MGSVFGNPTPHDVTFTRSEILVCFLHLSKVLLYVIIDLFFMSQVSEDVVDRLRDQESSISKKVASQIPTPAPAPLTTQASPPNHQIPGM